MRVSINWSIPLISRRQGLEIHFDDIYYIIEYLVQARCFIFVKIRGHAVKRLFGHQGTRVDL
jgi:hypothetical protein